MKESGLNDIMIEPSLIVSRKTIYNTFHSIRKFHTSKKFRFYLPETFQLLVYEKRLYEESPTFKFFQQNALPAKLSSIKEVLKEHSDIIKTFRSTVEHKEKHRVFLKYLSKELKESPWEESEYFDEYTLNILFEEWVFLQEHSLIVSRTKKTFNRFIKAGGICLQFSKETTERLIRKTLKKKDDELIDRIDKLRAIAKWIAVGGTPVLPFFNPIVSAFGSLISGYFLLFDPI